MTTLLSPRTARVLTAIVEFKFYNGYSPSVRDLLAPSGLASKSSVVHHLRKLRDRGYIGFEDGKSRTITVLRRTP